MIHTASRPGGTYILVEPLGRWREIPRYPSLVDGGASLKQINKSCFTSIKKLRTVVQKFISAKLKTVKYVSADLIHTLSQ